MDTLMDDFRSIERQMESALRRTVLKLHSDLIRVAPVDTGSFKRAWRVKKLSMMKWRITNNMEYASFLWRGHSKKWNGGDGMLEKANRNLDRKYDRIRA